MWAAEEDRAWVPMGWGIPMRIGIISFYLNSIDVPFRLHHIFKSFSGLPELSADQKGRLQAVRAHLVKDYESLMSEEGQVGGSPSGGYLPSS